LASGEPPAWLVGLNGRRHSVDPDYWNSDEALEAIENGEISNHPQIAGAARIVFKDSDLEGKSLWKWEREQMAQATKAVGAATPDQTPISNPGGAPVQKDWDAMWIEVVRLALYGNFPQKPAQLRKHLHDWFSSTGRSVPGETVMKEKVRALFGMMNAEDQKGGNQAK